MEGGCLCICFLTTGKTPAAILQKFHKKHSHGQEIYWQEMADERVMYCRMRVLHLHIASVGEHAINIITIA